MRALTGVRDWKLIVALSFFNETVTFMFCGSSCVGAFDMAFEDSEFVTERVYYIG